MAFNSDNFDLRNWKLTLPVGSSGSKGASEVKNLVGFEDTNSFYDAADGAMVFRASTGGATTSGSKYPRSELREMDGTSLASWNLARGGTMTATLEVDAVPLKSDGTLGRVIVGQIHGQDEELIRLYWDNGSVYFMNDQAGSANTETRFDFRSATGAAPNISLDEKFSYRIDARGDTLKVEVFADGQTYTSVTKINSVWQSDAFYFKAGLYLGVNASSGSGVGQTSFYGLDVGHTVGSGEGGWRAGATTPAPVPPVIGDIQGSNGVDTLVGTAGSDTISALAGNDMISGGAGSDVITTGSGSDILVYKSAQDGTDTITDFSSADRVDLSALFQEITGFKAEEAFGSRHVQIVSAAGDAQLWVDLDGAAGPGKATHLATFTNTRPGDLALDSLVLVDGPNSPPQPVPSMPEPTWPSTPTPVAPSKSLRGDGDDNIITGASGSDIIRGRGGNDVVSGGVGTDELWGNNGNDTLIGGPGRDWLKGGDGLDRYVFESLGDGVDTISDYRRGEKIDISSIVDDLPVSDAASFSTLQKLGFVSITDTGSYTNTLYVDYDGFAGSLSPIAVVEIIGIDDSVREGLFIVV